MNSNNNLVKKPKKEDVEVEEFEEDLEEDDDTSTSKGFSSDNLKKRMFILMGVIVGGTILLLLILYIASLFSTKTYKYSEIEAIMKSAAQAYFKDNSNYLPESDGDVVEVDVANLVAGGYMKDLSEYTSEGVSCTGSVQVSLSDSEYLYSPYLNCGDSYSTVELYKKIVTDDNIVSSGYGLYSNNGSYVYRGEEVDNYVQLDKSLWRIVKVTSNNNIMLISEEGVQNSQPWDDRYNEGRYYAAGINTYSASRIKEFLDRVYKSPDADNGEDLLSKKDKARLVTFNLCTGKVSQSSTTLNNSLECQEHLENQKWGLLTLSDYAYASIDPNCKTATSKSCQNYNYLAIDQDWWLVTADSDDNSLAYKVDKTGVPKAENANNYCVVRPVIYLSSSTLYKSGDGSLDKPYKVK